jgi:hypothetical protein
VTYVVTADETKACVDGYKAVQASLVAYMAHNNLHTVPVSVGTSDMTAPVLLYRSGATTTNPSFAPNSQTQWMYAWDSTGRITHIIAKPGGAYVLPGCTISSP